MRRAILAVGVAAAILAGAGVANASVPGPDGTIHGCYQTGDVGTGALYVVDSTDDCPAGFTGLNWDQTAPVGVAGYEVVTDTVTVTSAPAHTATADVACTTGNVPLGGGAAGSSSELVLVSEPVFDNDEPVGWRARVREEDTGSSSPIVATVWAICATEAP